jgi:hypothetical protein
VSATYVEVPKHYNPFTPLINYIQFCIKVCQQMDWIHEENENLEWYGWIMEAIQIE